MHFPLAEVAAPSIIDAIEGVALLKVLDGVDRDARRARSAALTKFALLALVYIVVGGVRPRS